MSSCCSGYFPKGLSEFSCVSSSNLTSESTDLQYIVVCCSVLQCVAVCCRVLTYVAVLAVSRRNLTVCSVLVAVSCSELQWDAVRCRVLQSVAECCRELHRVAVCCSVKSLTLEFPPICITQHVQMIRCVWFLSMGWHWVVGCPNCFVCLQQKDPFNKVFSTEENLLFCGAYSSLPIHVRKNEFCDFAGIIWYNTLHHTAPHCTSLHHTASHLQHTTTHCNWREHTPQCTTLYHAAPHCTTLHHTAPHCNILHHTVPRCTAIRCNTLQHTATHYSYFVCTRKSWDTIFNMPGVCM